MADILIPNVPQDVIAAIDLKAQRLGLSRGRSRSAIMRHFFANALIHADCSVKHVQAALGHKSVPPSREAHKGETHTSNRASAAKTSWRAHRTQLIASAVLTSTLS